MNALNQNPKSRVGSWVIVDDQLIAAAVVMQIALSNRMRIFGNPNCVVRPIRIDKTHTYVQRLVQVSNEVREQS